MPSKDELNPETISKVLTNAGKNIFSGIEFSNDPEFTVSDIIEYESRMRIAPLEKFNGPCYISVVNLFSSRQEQEAGNPIGAVIIYFNEDECAKLFRRLDFEEFNEDEEEEMLALCGQVIQKYNNSLVPGLKSSLGHSDIITSDPINYVNEVPGGIAFNYNAYNLYSTTFSFWKAKRVVVELTIIPSE